MNKSRRYKQRTYRQTACGSRGVTYTETLIALAVFCIAMIPVFPMLAAAGRDAALAREGYQAKLCAEGIAMSASEALRAGESPIAAAQGYVAALQEPPFAYGIWAGDSSYCSPEAPPLEVSAGVTGLPRTDQMVMIVAVAWTSDGRPAGRAAMMVNEP